MKSDYDTFCDEMTACVCKITEEVLQVEGITMTDYLSECIANALPVGQMMDDLMELMESKIPGAQIYRIWIGNSRRVIQETVNVVA